MAFKLFKKQTSKHQALPEVKKPAATATKAPKKISELMTKDAKVFFEKAKVAQKNNDVKTAIEYYRQAFSQSPKNTKIVISLANTLAKEGQPEEAEIYFREAEKITQVMILPTCQDLQAA